MLLGGSTAAYLSKEGEEEWGQRLVGKLDGVGCR
jgi:hypothetical protein